jgi:glucosamine 6-phosphate synthetase-like amidotransferase/phosphosugar isomerase protein
VVLTGCGDSHFAGIGAKLAFERDAGVRCQPLEALELTRYAVRYVPVVPRPPLLVAISYSGSVGRTIEAASTAQTFGWRTVALTGRAEGRLAQAVEPILMDVPTLGFSPGTSTYVAMLTALYTLAAELAAVAGRQDGADRADAALLAAPELARETIRLATGPAEQAAELIAAAGTSTFIGSGPHRASAEFGAAKLFEGPQRYGVAQQLEEWAHEQYFVSGPSTPIVVIAPSGAARDRAGELLSEMAFIGAPTILVSDLIDDSVAHSASVVLPIAAGLDEAYSPLLTGLPLALVAFFLAERLGATSYGFPSSAHEIEHYETIHRDTRREPA